MQIGKLPEPVLKRSVLDQIQRRRDEVLLSAAIGEDCAALVLKEDEVFVLSVDPITATESEIGDLAVHVTVNDLSSAGAEAVGLMVTLLLPPKALEEDVKRIMKEMEEAAAKAGVEILGGHTEVTPAVNQVLISVSGVGKAKKGSLIRTGGAQPGMELLLTKWVGLEGTAIIAKDREEELKKHLSEDFINTAKAFGEMISVQKEGRIAAENGAAAMHDVTEGGVFGALWELAEASGVGLTVDLRAIPIRQETVEICELYGLNPYELISSGSMLIAAKDGNRVLSALKENGIHAALIGVVTEGKERVLLNQGEKRFLTPPHTDEIYKVIESEKREND